MTSTFLQRRLALSRALAEREEQEIMPEIQLKPPTTDNDLVGKMQAALASAAREDIEHTPRQTLVRMFKTADLEEKFVFKTELGGGANYVQAMRQVLSRVRKRAVADKIELEDFKLFEVSIESKGDYDEVTLIRSAVMTQKEESVYTELMAQISLTKKQ